LPDPDAVRVGAVTPTRQGSFRLFRFAGIDVYLHWSWFLVAAFEVSHRAGGYSSLGWNALEYGALFGIVLMHEFGHALACRSVGGQAEQIVLWPLGGVAYVSPPQRPGATLWSIAAGPLVNVVLLPVLGVVWALAGSAGWAKTSPDVYRLLQTVLIINCGLLFFNLLPIFPLDGGQILRSLLWFVLGRARSLMVSSILGLASGAALLALVAWQALGGNEVLGNPVWLGILLVFILMNCWSGFQHARVLERVDTAPRHAGFACPACKMAPIAGEFWKCGRCQTRFDTFVTGAVCPRCGTQFPVTHCPQCGAASPIDEWIRPSASPEAPPPPPPFVQK
jgi:Zn-dependent protease